MEVETAQLIYQELFGALEELKHVLRSPSTCTKQYYTA